MKMTKIVNASGPEKGGFQAPSACQRRAGFARGGGQPGAKGGIEALDIGGIEHPPTDLGSKNDALRRLRRTIDQAPFHRGQAAAAVTLNDLDNLQVGPND